MKRYYLGPLYPNIYFSFRQAQCMAYFIKGYSNSEVAKILNISPGTVNYHVSNMKAKLDCKSKMELMAKIGATCFWQYLDELLAAKE